MKHLLIIALLALFAHAASAAELNGVQFEDKTQLSPDSAELVLNGLGQRKAIFIKVYVGALYLPKKSTNAGEIIAGTGPRRVAMTLQRDVSAKQFSDAFNEGLRDNSSPPELERYKAQIEELLALMHSLNEVKKGDVVRVDYLPESGTRVQINGETRGKSIPDPEFYRMILRVWLGEKPVDTGLKEGMLGG